MLTLRLRVLSRRFFGPAVLGRLGRITNRVRGFFWHRFRSAPPYGARLWYGWGARALGPNIVGTVEQKQIASVLIASKKMDTTQLLQYLDAPRPAGTVAFVATGSWAHWTQIRNDRLLFVRNTSLQDSPSREIRQLLSQYHCRFEYGNTTEGLTPASSRSPETRSSNIGPFVPVATQPTRKKSRKTPTSFSQAWDGPVNVVDHSPQNFSWILSRISKQLVESLNDIGVDAILTSVPMDSASIVHHFIFLSPWEVSKNSLHTTLVTHIDESWKMSTLKGVVGAGAIPIAASSETARLVGRELAEFSRGNPPFVPLPPLVEANIQPFKVGVFTRVYGDFRKREFELVNFAKHFGANEILFKIMGDGWENVISSLHEKNFEVDYHPEFNSESYLAILDSVDAVLYFGWDEGAVGCVDALARGKLVVAPPIGYHLDYNSDNMLFASNGAEAANALYQHVARRKEMRNMFERASWENYALSHLEIWNFFWEIRENQ